MEPNTKAFIPSLYLVLSYGSLKCALHLITKRYYVSSQNSVVCW
jgi:hypothetical protein